MLIVIALLILFVLALYFFPAGFFRRVQESGAKSQQVEEKKAVVSHPGMDEQLIKALSKTALIHFDINLTKDRIIGGVIQEYADGSSIDVLESVGLHADCRLSEFYAAWRDFVEPGSLPGYDKFLNAENLIEAFRAGNEEVSLTYETVNARREETWAKQTMMMREDPDSGDVIAFCYAHDVTKQMQREAANAKEKAS